MGAKGLWNHITPYKWCREHEDAVGDATCFETIPAPGSGDVVFLKTTPETIPK